MTKKAEGRIRVGIGGWTFEPWRGTFFPDKLSQKRELEYASSKLTSIEVNGTYYGSMKPATFAKWHEETPDDFVFALKGPRFATNRKILAEAGDSVERFFKSGVLELKDKLGPINWQLMGTKKFDPEDFAKFLALLPRTVEGRAIQHAVEVRHESFADAEVIAAAREQGIAIITAGDSEYVEIADTSAPFVYARIQGTSEDEKLGYSKKALDTWAERAKTWASGSVPSDMKSVGKADAKKPRDVFLYVISGHKERNPQAAMALLERLG
ncbi:hypothetical protein GJW-30_1_01493 [Variibacter gotjawalensis]|uniref:DUF72 domain-containing protein n=1 Tax=Variibacter gotjawalensis TaxID=1333996 RepID=A0A0S3PSM4_9BRAD|nr:DUF72 domain-containing protein [Variibacter gotjawalensis]NIK49279.1 uncharacterized protein YecE (DUF72 family) [Variibacter gotjawalensis]RZS51130.1 uncharacterized protein YecE (DUF72 family) [Variibacter gotjawalensis]BAT58965.1 hypothetical protein GJW-30_1_01493 [Variibacter gotjawalensis]